MRDESEIFDISFDLCNNNQHSCLSIPKVNIEDYSYEEFFHKFLLGNQPCVLEENCTKEWTSRRDWVQNQNPNIKYLQKHFGSTTVPVADCSVKEYNAQRKEDMTFDDYAQYWTSGSDGRPLLYLKDWHFTKDFPECKVYRPPKVFASDWLNEYWLNRRNQTDDYQFVYLGPKGSWTPLHADVFLSYSWSANICGEKQWTFFPPGDETYLKNRYGNLMYDYNEDRKEEDYPNISKIKGPIQVTQKPGQVIFVPSGWHHQVLNTKDTLSINHNWFNGCNIEMVWSALQECLERVKKEIWDCRDMEDWEGHCQVLLAATHGFNYSQLYSLLECIATRRIEALSSSKKVTFHDWELGSGHAVFDLRCALPVIKSIVQNLERENVELNREFDELDPDTLIRRVEDVIH